MRHKPNPSFDEVEMAAVRKRLTTAGLGLWQEAEASAGLAADAGPTRHSARSGRPITVWTCQPEDDS